MLKIITNPIVSPPYLEGEKWELITDNIVNNIRPYYYISNYARIFSGISNRLLSPTVANNGYLVVNVTKNDESQICIYIHRITMLVFCNINGSENLHVNHKDGNKLNNQLYNLEWTTIEENTRHAWRTGLCIRGEECSWAKLSDNEVHEICKKYINGYGITQLSKIYNCGVTTIFDIIHGKSRTDISSQYNIIIRKRNNKQ